MSRCWSNRNACLSAQDPAYDDGYDAEEDYEAYLDACEMREDKRREEYD